MNGALRSAPDFSQPGGDGALPQGFKEWQWGVAYTVRPQMLLPPLCGREYKIFAAVRRRISAVGEFTGYAELYRRAKAIADARISAIASPDPVHTWIAAHAWLCTDVGPQRIANAVLTMGVIRPHSGDPKPEGASPPTQEQLTAAGGMMRESLATELAGSTPFDEIYSDFDWRDPSSEDRGICLFSYGEYVSSRNLDYRPILERAERFAQFHCDLLNGASVPDEKLKIVRREWFCATHPDIAVVHVYFRA